MRANPAVMAGGDSTNPYLLEYDSAADPAPALANACFGSADCTPAEMAGFDVYETLDALRSRFPRGRMLVCRDAGEALSWDCEAAAGAPLVIKLGWRGNEAPAQGEPAPSVALVVRGAS
jgi:type IV pilus assembly protein PilV